MSALRLLDEKWVPVNDLLLPNERDQLRTLLVVGREVWVSRGARTLLRFVKYKAGGLFRSPAGLRPYKATPSALDEEVVWKVVLHSVAEADDFDRSSRQLDRPRFKIERRLSFEERSLSDLSVTGNLRAVDSYGSMHSFGAVPTPTSPVWSSFELPPMVDEAWDALRKSVVFFRGQAVGTIAAVDHASREVLNYDQVTPDEDTPVRPNTSVMVEPFDMWFVVLHQVFVRDFVPSALAFLMTGEHEIVKNFLLKTIHLQSWEKKIDQFKLGEGVMPASFKVNNNPTRKTETLMADFGESAIGRVAPVDSGFWWIILLRAYTKSTGDLSLSETPEC
ncbi:hypothetical protein BHE74_00050674 [Ensete ventricosum]|nr:hypothetical protein BHE74_00050674 [Ensete ventricosum]